MKLQAFYFEIGAVVAVLLVVGLAPLLFLLRPLLAASLQGRRESGLLAMRYAEQFRVKWLGERSPDEKLLGTSDIQSLADLGVAYERVARMRVLPLDRQAIVRAAMLIALPFAPLLFTAIPLNELLARALKQLL
jgi:hypothetical protein